ncbi:chorismate mutase [Aureimonas altamirensis DSM 21988]|uniref:chorismate mutase n=1 Tax=Aureimonas altamirensis DSM 21988 TaxID=1121026 RepID=A0ABY1ID88_9HYPH|nr:chorismate mutase [Aureimonas altamirensis]SHJ00045.1 chorismate mutase [Aureimonas altamirensis DSM 21988]
MANGQAGDATKLSELRAKIDAIDESIHHLLMQRATVIDELIAAKGTQKHGAAFRPGREADMMHRLVARHRGHLPITAVEHLWREIISTFTALQAPFEVAVSTAGDIAAAVDTARFTCGFSVPMHLVDNASAAIDRVEKGDDWLGIVMLKENSGAWWQRLGRASIVARLPFIEQDGRPAGEPALVLAPPLADPVPFEIECHVIEGDGTELAEGFTVLASAEGSCLVAGPRGVRPVSADRLETLDIRPVGGYAAPLRA